jgi:hypothetical protein
LTIDVNADGLINANDIVDTLDAGEVLFIEGTPPDPNNRTGTPNVAQANDIHAGASITASNKVGVDVLFGGIDCFGTRNVNILPASFYAASYYTPVPTVRSNATAAVYLYNPLSTAMTITWTSNTGSGTISVPARTTLKYDLPLQNSGFKFENTNGDAFVAMEVIDADANGSTYDWAFAMTAAERLTDFTSIAWAPGSLDGSRNDGPIWVTPTGNTTLYIKYDGDLTSGTPNLSPCGLAYDLAVSLNEFDIYKVLDNTDNDQSGVALFTCDGNSFVAVYGEDPSTANTGSPSLDVGTTMQPMCKEIKVFANSDFEVTPPDVPVLIDLPANDNAFLTTVDPTSVSNAGLMSPSHGSILIQDDGTVLYTPDPGWQGIDNFTYRVCSSDNPSICDIAVATVKVTDCNAKPGNVILNGYVYLEQNPDNGAFDNETLVPGVKVEVYRDFNGNGSIDAPTDTLVQTTHSRASGAYSFTLFTLGDYVARVNPDDGHYVSALLNTTTASFAAFETCVNDRYLGVQPVMDAINDTLTAIVDQTRVVAVLDNDLGVPDLASIDTTGLLQPLHGTVLINGDGTFTYQPDPGFTGSDAFEYQVCSIWDATLCDIARVVITVSCQGTPGQNDITGIVFSDANDNASLDAGEIGAAGITISLYQNNAPLATRGPEDVLVETVATDATGNYAFTLNHNFLVAGTPYQQRTLSEDDDAREKANGEVQTDQDLKITRAGDDKWNGFRFTNLNIPNGAVITQAYLRFTSMSGKSNTAPAVRFYGQDDTASAAAFVDGSTGTLTSRTRTTQTVDWLNIGAWVKDQSYNSPDLSSIIQEIINDQGGLSNGAIVLITEAIGDDEERKAYDFGADNTKSPELYIAYEVPYGPFNYILELNQGTLPLGSAINTANQIAVSFAADGTQDCGNNFGYFIADIDLDDDGVSNVIESGGYEPMGDEDGDGTFNWQDTLDNGLGDGSATSYVDGDGNGIPDVFDTDGDGVPNFLDLDSDNDGVTDIVEAGGEDTNGDGKVDALEPDGSLSNDTDQDGLDDLYDANNGGNAIPYPDTDGDGIADALDRDADNDAIPDVIEAGGIDANGDGRADNFVDVDGDGLHDEVDGDVGNDGTIENALAVLVITGADTNGDGLPESYPRADRDGDGILNLKDLDSDNDGITDVIELGAADLNWDGIVDGSDDVDQDGFIDLYDPNAADGPGGIGIDGSPKIFSTVDGSDNDGRLEILSPGIVDGDDDDDDVANFLDVDSDNDGIYDLYEAQPTDNLLIVDGTDSDGDGIDDAFDSNDAVFGGSGIDPIDTDGDGDPDYLDRDADGDAVPDWQEAWDSMLDGDSRPDSANWADCKVDSDGDGLVDAYDNDDNNADDWTISILPPDDDGTGGSTVSAGIDVLSNNQLDDIFPNNGFGDDIGEPDFRDAGNAACSSAKMVYAITDPVSMYQYNEISGQHETGLSTGVIRATVLCHPIAGWYRFYNPLEPKRFLFAIQNGTNTVDLTEAIDYVELEITSEPVVSKSADNAYIVMARSWKVELKDSLNGTVNIRFYFEPDEYAAFDSVVSQVSQSYISGSVQSKWFKIENGLDYGNVPSKSQYYISEKYADLNLRLDGESDGQADKEAKGNDKNFVQFNGLSTFSGGTIGADITGTLPVEWLDFTVKQQGEDAILDWVTASELQADYFALERSVDGRFFTEIGRQKAVGNSQEGSQYTYQDQDVIFQLGHRIYYRLRQVDQDGSYSFSEVVELELEDQWDVWFNAMPVPVDDILTVRYDLFWQQRAQIELLNLLGSQLQIVSLTEKSGKVELDVSRLPAGIYYLRLQGEDRQVVRKIEVRH